MTVRSSLVPQYDLPARNRRVLLARRPVGIPQPDDFAFDDAPVSSLPAGRFLVRNIFLSVDPAQRGWASDVANYSDPVAIGSVMRALAVGIIVESRHDDFAVDSFVYGWLGWQDYAVAEPADILTRFNRPMVPLSAYAGVLGINGLTAYIALTSLGHPRRGETVLVSTAAGAVGSIVGQLAKGFGCRTVGLTGDDAKVRRCLDRLGYDAAINYRSMPAGDLLAPYLPDGADIFFDNVGGSILDNGLRHMRPGGRVIQCGTASIASWSPPPQGLRNEREVLTRRLVWSGFVIFDHAARFNEAIDRLTSAIEAGSLVYDEDIEVGMEHAPDAIRRLYAGENSGKKLIQLGTP